MVFGVHARLEACQPDAADLTVAAFAARLQGTGGRPPGSLAQDVSALRLAERIHQTAAAV